MITGGRVVAAGGVIVKERLGTGGRVLRAGGVTKECLPTDGRVVVGVVSKKRLEPDARVAGGRRVQIERLITNTDILAAG